MKKISMSDYLETLVADYLTNYGVPSTTEVPEMVSETEQQEQTEPQPEAPKKRAKRGIKKNDTE
jgi:hypothetical protein